MQRSLKRLVALILVGIALTFGATIYVHLAQQSTFQVASDPGGGGGTGGG